MADVCFKGFSAFGRTKKGVGDFGFLVAVQWVRLAASWERMRPQHSSMTFHISI